MSGEGFISSGSEGLEMVFHSGEVGVRDDGGKGMGFKVHHEKEQGFAGDRVGAVIMYKLSMGNHFEP